MMQRTRDLFLLLLIGGGFIPSLSADSHASQKLIPWIEAIKAVGPEGHGNAEASKAWQALSKSGPETIPFLLVAMDSAGDLSRNWLRSAVESIAQRIMQEGGQLPIPELGKYLLDTRHDPQARRLAFDMISQVQPEATATLVPGMLNDPSVELRFDAVAKLIEKGDGLAKAENKNAAILVYQQAIGFARDIGQIQHVSKALKALEQSVDLPMLFGFIMNWKIIGPFDNSKRTGFDAPFPPEKNFKLSTSHQGKNGMVKWTGFVSQDEYGKVDINKVCGSLKEVTAYAHSDFHSDSDRPAELRLGCKNAWKIWFNGQYVFGRDEYHRGQQIDQYRIPVNLQKGKNTILVKICQNEQTESWTVEWEFQLRMCDATGTAILSTDRIDAPLTGVTDP